MSLNTLLEYANAFCLSLLELFASSAFPLMLIGIGIGFIVGILPGLGGPTALALMLPFIFKMNAFDTFAFLLGVAAVVGTTGDITSILFGIPGEPTSIAIIVDGHPMAKKGEAGRALGAALASSLIGAVFGAFVLALAIPFVRPLVVAFGSPEYFLLGLLGITFVVTLSGRHVLKGLTSGGIGLFLGTVGLDQVTGVARFTFEQSFLWDGVGLVPVAIGLFAIPEMIDLAIRGTGIAQVQIGKLGGIMQGVKDSLIHWRLVLRCSAIGSFVSIIPGLGAATTQWLAYAHSVQSSPDKERFGKGAVEGVLGPGAANNSTLGGSLITTVAFGIPASVTMAILLGAFIIQGIVPGPNMLIPEPKGHLTLTYSFVWINVFSNIIAVGICFLFLKQLVRVTSVRGSIVIPIIMLLIYIGTFAERNDFHDLLLLLLFGFLGWAMEKFEWPRPPLVLGLVLSPILQDRFFISIERWGVSWLMRPSALVLIALTLASVFYPIFRRRRGTKKEAQELDTASADDDEPRFGWGTIFTLFILLTSGCALWKSLYFSFRAGIFPWIIGFLVLTLALVQSVKDLSRKGRHAVQAKGQRSRSLIHAFHRPTAAMFGWIVSYFVSIWALGFPLGGSLCALGQLKYGARERWLTAIVISASAFVMVYWFFGRVLHVPFPEGRFTSLFFQ